MKKLLFFLCLTFIMSSCSQISGKYSQVNIGYLGMDNSVSQYEFGLFGSVKYYNSTSGSRSSNSFYAIEGKYNTQGSKLILNFGGSDRILSLSDDNSTITDEL